MTTKQLGAQDYANVALAGMSLVATFIVGRIAVDSIIEQRRENFERKGQPKEAVKAKETTMDGVVKLAGTIYSIYMLQQQVPGLLAEARKLLE